MNALQPGIAAVGTDLKGFTVVAELKRLGVPAVSHTNTRLVGSTAVLLATLALAGCGSDNSQVLQGWVEADLIFVSPDQQGRVETLSVHEGDVVGSHAPLFIVDDDLQRADLAVKMATVMNAQRDYDRAQQLLKTATGTQKTYDDADAALRQATANLAGSQTHLRRRIVFSPSAGTIEQVYYRPGETVLAGRPIVALLPPGNLKLRFFVPQALLPEIEYGETVEVSCDGCETGLKGTVSFISRSAEFTPPVIYSLEERAKLVFLIEARPEHPNKFRVGQPVTVTLPKDRSQ